MGRVSLLCYRPLLSARLAYAWVCRYVRYDASTMSTNSCQSANAVLSARKSTCNGFVNLYQALCEGLGVPGCERVLGYCSGGAWDSPEARRRATTTSTTTNSGRSFGLRVFGDDPGHAWACVAVGSGAQRSLFLCDPTWGSLAEHAADGSTRGKARLEFGSGVWGQKSSGEVARQMHTMGYYFGPPPEELILTHFPVRPQHQLLPRQVTVVQFCSFPWLQSGGSWLRVLVTRDRADLIKNLLDKHILRRIVMHMHGICIMLMHTRTRYVVSYTKEE